MSTRPSSNGCAAGWRCSNRLRPIAIGSGASSIDGRSNWTTVGRGRERQRRTALPRQGVASVRGSFQAAVKEVAADEPAPAPVALDVSRANAVLGTPIAVDDLKVVDGIGPKIESLCHGIGIVTWFDLSTTEVSLLRTMLADAGSRFRVHDPSTWPEQAALLAAGRWADFKALTDGLRGGRTTN